jgi:hypothetical protein
MLSIAHHNRIKKRSLCDDQSNELTGGPHELVHHFHHFRLEGEFKSAQERCLSQIWYGLAISLANHSGEEWGNFLVQMIITSRRMGGGSAPCGVMPADGGWGNVVSSV